MCHMRGRERLKEDSECFSLSNWKDEIAVQ